MCPISNGSGSVAADRVDQDQKWDEDFLLERHMAPDAFKECTQHVAEGVRGHQVFPSPEGKKHVMKLLCKTEVGMMLKPKPFER